MATKSVSKRAIGARRWLWGARLAAALMLVVVIGGGVGLAYFHVAPPERTCLSCHEILDAYDRWHRSAHRDVGCQACHGGTLSAGLHGLLENGRRVLGHLRRTDLDRIVLSEPQILRMQGACRRCHAGVFAAWQSGPHAATYADIYLDATHNHTETPNNDCLRCHGMFYAGRIGDLVAPLDRAGPWFLREPARGPWPTIPCLACHTVHRSGPRVADPNHSRAAKVAFYDRYERRHWDVDVLPTPALTWEGTPVPVSADPRQRLCVQCHAPESSEHAGTADDKTPRGVHAGISCLVCHHPHTLRAEGACAQCHVPGSHHGHSVTDFPTSNRDPEGLDIHTLRCADCHG